MKNIPFSIGVLVILSACGSVETTRYAQPGDAIGPGSTFATQDAKRFVWVNGGVSLRDQTIQISFSEDGQSATVVQNHKTFNLTYDSASDTFRNGDGSAILFPKVSGSDVVMTVLFQERTPGFYNGGNSVIGFHTDPTEIATLKAISGTALYSGQTSLTARTLAQDGFAVGDVALSADFGTDTVTGLMTIIDDGGAGDLYIPTSTITINPGNVANISGNSFDAALDIVLGATSDTIVLDQSGLTGGFYGVDAAAIGATYWATGTFNGDPLFVEGALASDN